MRHHSLADAQQPWQAQKTLYDRKMQHAMRAMQQDRMHDRFRFDEALRINKRCFEALVGRAELMFRAARCAAQQYRRSYCSAAVAPL
jgi:hypothetical protein